jgi:hypothetical protein
MEERILVAIHPGRGSTRVLVTGDAGETILKARLERTPWHARALPTLLEALALWQKQKVHGVVFAGSGGSPYGSSLCATLDAEHERTPLYTVDVVEARRPPRQADQLRGMGDYRDLRQLLLFERLR